MSNINDFVIKDDVLLEYIGNDSDVVIPDNVTSITGFYMCKSLTSITVPDSIVDIDEGAFKDCENLTIYATAGSYAEEYAEENNIPFKAID